MASVTPGALMKLLKSMNSSSGPVAACSGGDHRSPVLQVTGIAPATSDLWPSPAGFYLQLSDSVNSTYVFVPDRDPSAAGSLHLGQLLHVDRLLPSHPLPLAPSLRPIPLLGRRSPPPLLGSPQPLSVSSSPDDPSSFLILPDRSNPAPPPAAPADAPPAAPAAAAPPKRRPASPASVRRDPSPGSRARAGSRASSPVPSKCAVPSLVAAKEERRAAAREAAIVVPSRYRNPSPVGGRRAASPGVGRRGSVSPGGRRLSIGGGDGSGGGCGGRKKGGVVVARVSEGSAVKSMRRSWEENSGEGKEKGGRSKVDQQAILRTQVAISQRLSDAGKEQQPPNGSEEEEAPRNEKKRIVKRTTDSSSLSEKSNHHAPARITVHDCKWTDGSISLDAVSENLSKLGKEALQRRNLASMAAAEALEDALATESFIRCLSMFSDLCSSSKAGNPLPTIDRFLSIYEDTIKCTSISESLASTRSTGGLTEVLSLDRTKPASLWVEAALATDLEVVSLVSSTLDSNTKQKIFGKPAAPLVDTTKVNFSKKNSFITPVKGQAKVSTTNMWSKGQSISETVNFAKSLRREMQNWFMKFVEDALDVGFRLFGEVLEDGREASCKDNGRVAAVLSQLKRVNDWLDAVGKKPEEETILVEKIERLKRKIYGFVITHVGSAFDSSVSLSKVG